MKGGKGRGGEGRGEEGRGGEGRGGEGRGGEGRGGEGRGGEGRGGCEGRNILQVSALKHGVWLTRPLSRIKHNHDPGSVSNGS